MRLWYINQGLYFESLACSSCKNSKSKNHLILPEQFEILKEGNSRSAKIRWKFKRYSENIKDVQTSDA